MTIINTGQALIDIMLFKDLHIPYLSGWPTHISRWRIRFLHSKAFHSPGNWPQYHRIWIAFNYTWVLGEGRRDNRERKWHSPKHFSSDFFFCTFYHLLKHFVDMLVLLVRVWVLCLDVSIYTTHAPSACGAQTVGSTRTGLRDNAEPPGGCCDLNLGPCKNSKCS